LCSRSRLFSLFLNGRGPTLPFFHPTAPDFYPNFPWKFFEKMATRPYPPFPPQKPRKCSSHAAFLFPFLTDQMFFILSFLHLFFFYLVEFLLTFFWFCGRRVRNLIFSPLFLLNSHFSRLLLTCSGPSRFSLPCEAMELFYGSIWGFPSFC